jgi:hypothetical protein
MSEDATEGRAKTYLGMVWLAAPRCGDTGKSEVDDTNSTAFGLPASCLSCRKVACLLRA